MEELSPMMQKYLATKEEYKDCILFYRLGDFYEMFFQDAITVSKELELTLTGKSCGLKERAPMCGVPFHSVDSYINRLVEKGYKVAICDQVEDPKEAKGLVKREVTRIVTKGTNLDIASMDGSKNNYLMAIVCMADTYGISLCDITTGEFIVTEVDTEKKLEDEIYRFEPAEIVCNEPFMCRDVNIDELKYKLSFAIYSLESWYFEDSMCSRTLKEHFKLLNLEGLGLTEGDVVTIAAGALLKYISETQIGASLDNIRSIKRLSTNSYMLLDSATRRNLELTETMRDKQKKGSLFGVLDKTRTAMGARQIRSFIEQPLLSRDKIEERLETVDDLYKNDVLREELREYLTPIYDLERLMCKVNYRSANPRDLIAFRQSLSMLPPIKGLIEDTRGKELKKLFEELDSLDDIYALIDSAIEEEPPIQIKEGGIIKKGYNETVDSLRQAKTEGKKWLAKLEEDDRERTGIKNLRIKYNKVFGYYFEVTKSNIDLVPDDYIRKQTLTNAERYTTNKLKELEDMILNSEDRLFSLEYDLFSDIRNQIAAQIDRIQKSAKIIARLDAFASLAHVAKKNSYVRPRLNEKGIIDIKCGRHPVVERMIEHDLFIDNDTYLDNSKNRVNVITGPNMAGKSTYMRQTALIVLMAQIGSFVPAREANIGLVDRIFTRVGASDDLSSGQSTFMVEMSEVANILRNASSKSLLILDEIGRGTSTFDGLSIAWAVIEYIANTRLLGSKALFATHYHELTELEGKIDSVNNYCVAVKEQGDDIVFLRKIVKGGADRSYGIQVAKLAGVPDTVIDRANELSQELSENDITYGIRINSSEGSGKKKKQVKKLDELDLSQMSLFDTVKDDDIINELKEMDVDHMTPMDALNTLNRIKNTINNRWG
ncbi:MAG: DNA mismatch repair protein MutS [Lachnospiraceae bacterium]|nr:DNA mismatch repair protein MutS [Lachnospiraceae bacterium]